MELQDWLDLYKKHRSYAKLREITGRSYSFIKARLDEAVSAELITASELAILRGKVEGYVHVNSSKAPKVDFITNELGYLKKKVKELEREKMTEDEIRHVIFGLSELDPTLPKWLYQPKKTGSNRPGVPTLHVSDIHYGEVIRSPQIQNINSYNIQICRDRFQKLVFRTIRLLKEQLFNSPEYPGIVVAVGGDIFSGNIHEELRNTNEVTISEAFADLAGMFKFMFLEFKKHFGKVFVPWVPGNHGRMTDKPTHKNAALTNFDSLLGMMLEMLFQDQQGRPDPDIKILVSPSTNYLYSVYDHRFLLNHGNEFRGGDGIIGPRGPIERGDVKKRARNSQVGLDYDTQLIGHFHSKSLTDQVSVNGSLKGYDEFAFSNNFKVQAPLQSLLMNHPDWGLTLSTSVYVTDPPTKKISEWVKWT